MTPTIYFAANLKYLRDQKDHSQARFARFIGIPHKRYQSYELGHAQPDIAGLAAIAKRLHMTLDELLLKRLGE